MANNVNVTNRGFEYVCQWANIGSTANTTTWLKPGFIGWGTANGSNASSVLLPATAPSNTIGTGQWSDIAPFYELPESRVAGTLSVTSNTVGAGTVTAQVTGTITATAAESVGESFLVMSSTKPAMSSVATGNMTNVQTSLTTATAMGIAAPYYIQIDNEVLFVSATAASNVLTVVRGTNATTGAAHNLNAGVTLGNVPGAGASNPNNGDMFAHAGFQALALNNGDSIAFTWQVNVTS